MVSAISSTKKTAASTNVSTDALEDSDNAAPESQSTATTTTTSSNSSLPNPGSFASGLPANVQTDNPEMLAFSLLQGAAQQNNTNAMKQAQSLGEQTSAVATSGLQAQTSMSAAANASNDMDHQKELDHKKELTKYSNDLADYAFDAATQEKQTNIDQDFVRNQISNLQSLTKKAAEAMRIQ